MKVLISLLLVIGVAVVWCANYQRIQYTSCETYRDCPSRAPCCRDDKGNAIVEAEGVWSLLETNGTCSNVLGVEGDLCGSNCGCKPGYKCYRPISGVCCLPPRCNNATWVDEQEEKWANCHPPTCFLPP